MQRRIRVVDDRSLRVPPPPASTTATERATTRTVPAPLDVARNTRSEGGRTACPTHEGARAALQAHTGSAPTRHRQLRADAEPGGPVSHEVGPYRHRSRSTSVRPIRRASRRVGTRHPPQPQAPAPVHAARRQGPVGQLAICRPARHHHASGASRPAARDTVTSGTTSSRAG